MLKTTKYIIIVLWILISRMIDIYCTYIFTPNLTKEANPLVYIFGLSWTPLVIIISLVLFYAIYSFTYITFSTYSLHPFETGYSLKEFATFIYLGKKDSLISILYKFPIDRNRMKLYFGNVLYRCLVYIGIVTTIMWYLIFNTNYYQLYHNPVLVFIIVVIGIVLIVYYWTLSEYNKYQNINVINT